MSIMPIATVGAEWLREYPEILQFSRVVTYQRKDIIIREGTPCDVACILLNGTAMSFKTSETGSQMLICFVPPGTLFGFMAMFGTGVQTITVEALEPCKNLEIDKVQLKRLLLTKPEMLWEFAEVVAGGVANYADIVETSFHSVEQRIYKCLINLSEQFGCKVANGIELTVNLTQENLATYAGTTRVTAARILSSLIEHGIVRVKPKPWLIYRIDRLLKLSGNTNTCGS
jgi:CRP/FNR family cyclic AMP-dependent transcriptional regulator